jgi:hypothetical protein
MGVQGGARGGRGKLAGPWRSRWQWRDCFRSLMPASHFGPLAGLPPALDLQPQRLEQGAARGALLDRFEELIQAPAGLAEQVAGLVEEG